MLKIPMRWMRIPNLVCGFMWWWFYVSDPGELYLTEFSSNCYHCNHLTIKLDTERIISKLSNISPQRLLYRTLERLCSLSYVQVIRQPRPPSRGQWARWWETARHALLFILLDELLMFKVTYLPSPTVVALALSVQNSFITLITPCRIPIIFYWNCFKPKELYRCIELGVNHRQYLPPKCPAPSFHLGRHLNKPDFLWSNAN